MNPVTRRTFLRQAGLGAAAVGVATTVPSFLRKGVKSGTVPTAAKPLGRISQTGPVVAHVSDANSGDITLMFGTSELTYHNPELAHQLIRATQ